MVASLLTIVSWIAARFAQLYPKKEGLFAAGSKQSHSDEARPLSLAQKVLIGVVLVLTTIVVQVIEQRTGLRIFLIASYWCGVRLLVLLVQETMGDSRNSVVWCVTSWSIPTIITAGWMGFPNWVTLNSTGIMIVCAMLITMRHISPRAVVIISFVIMVFDIVAVYASDIMLKIVGVYDGMPGMLWVPKDWSLAGGFGVQNRIMDLGLGDLFFPGLSMIYIARIALEKNAIASVVGAYLGYIFGGAIAMSVSAVTHTGQPATIFLIPAVFVGYRLGNALAQPQVAQ
ncbi:hypothetical protein HYW17_01060 [Candidatus Uhrbacteria bacterium]|nr:hypothetical protein [Candidatus Uhrbacteria bacterium]